MEQTVGGVDQSCDLLGAEHLGESSRPLGIGRQLDVPIAPERLDVEEPQGGEPLRHGVGGELALRDQVRLIGADLIQPQLRGRALEVERVLRDGANVAANRVRGIVATLELFEHLSA